MSTIAYPTFRTTSASPRLVLTRRGRRVIAFLIALPIALTAMLIAISAGEAAATNAQSVSSGANISWVTINAGDTLWSVAERVAPARDPRDVIAEIVSLNQLRGDLQPGQRIAIPAGF